MIQREFGQFSSDDPWYLIHCQRKKEFFAAHALRRYLGLFVYVPEYKVRRRGEIHAVTFFPGYIFARVNLLRITRSQINTTPGVLRLVDFGGDPQTVPYTVVEEIAQRLEQMNVICPESFQPGDVVRVKRGGPLQDLEMIFVGSTTPGKRVCVLLSLLGRLKEVRVDIDSLEKVPFSDKVIYIDELSQTR